MRLFQIHFKMLGLLIKQENIGINKLMLVTRRFMMA